jgi:hypothetical protein
MEWEQAEGVTHPALAETWARLEISVGATLVTMVHDARTGSVRTGVYGPMFLVAEWIVRNFWFLHSECVPGGSVGRAWLRRHSLASTREGTSLPDLRLFRDEGRIIADFHAERRDRYPVTFLTAGREELDPAGTRRSLSDVVDAVLERVRGSQHPDVVALRSDWEAVVSASGVDATVCRRAAQLGLDAFEPDEVDESLAEVLSTGVDQLPAPIGGDVLDASVAPERLAPTLGAVAHLVAAQGGGTPRLRGGLLQTSLVPPSAGGRPYEVGYALARSLRAQGDQQGGRLDLERLVESLGWRGLHQRAPSWSGFDHHVKAIVGVSCSTGRPELLSPPKKTPERERFLLARGLFALLSGATADAPRALTGAGTKLQATSRAFAAELLAPANELRTRLSDDGDDEQIEELAAELGVGVPVIELQIANHGLGRCELPHAN